MKETKITVLRQQPFIAFIDNILSKDECTYVTQRLEKLQFDLSMGLDYKKNEDSVSEYRTSQTFFDNQGVFSDFTELMYAAIKDRFWYLPFSIKNLEPVQAQKYGVGNEYKKHCDYFNHSKEYYITDNDRIATIIVYLNDDFEGGETEFHELGLKVKPKAGAALYFEYNYITELNYKTIHSGNPVTKGEKLIFTTWIRREEFKGH